MKLGAAILAAGALTAAAQGPGEPAGLLDRWLHNPRERTAEAMEAYQEGRPEEAVTYAAAAYGLDPEDPRTAFNAGTAELAHKQPERARVFFEEAVGRLSDAAGIGPANPLPKTPDQLPRSLRGLAPDLYYNLGNARLEAGDPAAAVEAYEQALRLAPARQDAKFNLELALEELARKSSAGETGPQGAQGRGEGDGEDPGGSDDGPEKPSSEEPEDGETSGSPEADPAADPAPQPSPAPTPRQSFADQPDMTAEEAAAILEAVENLERQQRRDAAMQRARQTAKGGKDW